MKCCQCQEETTNPKFCSRSCSTKESNKIPKRKKTKQCKECNSLILGNHTYCTKCWDNRIKDMSLSDAIYKKHHKSSAFALVRSRARAIMKDVKSCQTCGYSKHVEIAHIKPISTFSKETMISAINNKNNLLALCRNCHWEFDNEIGVPGRT